MSGQLFNAVFNSECKKAEANTRQFSIDEDQVGTIKNITGYQRDLLEMRADHAIPVTRVSNGIVAVQI